MPGAEIQGTGRMLDLARRPSLRTSRALPRFPHLHPQQSAVSSRALRERSEVLESKTCAPRRTSHSKEMSSFVLERRAAASRFCPGIGPAHHSGPSPAHYQVEFYSGVNIVSEALGTRGRQASEGSRKLRVQFHMMTVEDFSSLRNMITW